MLEHEASRSYQPSNTGIAAYYQADGLALRLPRVPSTHHLHGESPAEEVMSQFFAFYTATCVCVHIIAARSSFSRTVFLERSEGREGQHARVKGERVGEEGRRRIGPHHYIDPHAVQLMPPSYYVNFF